MRFFFLLPILTFWLHAMPFTLDNISLEIEKSIDTRLKGKNKPLVKALYETTKYQLIWLGKEHTQRNSSLIKAFNTPLFNYKHKSFNQKVIKQLFFLIDNNELSPQKLASVYARLDVILTNSFLRLVRFIIQGDVNWQLVQKKFKALKEEHDINCVWEMHPKQFHTLSSLKEILNTQDITPYLNSLIPMEKRYKSLIVLLNNYQQMDKFPKLKYYKKNLQKGDKSKRIKPIKKRLQISGDYPKEIKMTNTFDEILEKAIINYQMRHLLKITKQIDKKLTYYLNQPASKKIEAIITNLDKTKLYPKTFEKEHIEINIPDFNFRYYEDHLMIKKMGLVVGRIDRPTPLFSNNLKYMVINPTWTIPDNLIKRDLIHVLHENPNYLQEQNIHAYQRNKELNITYEMLAHYENNTTRVPYRFVQLSGANNALGRVKFMFPNKYAVYLHDTNNKSLLEQRYKLYSSGCMRIKNPFELVTLLLEKAKKSYSSEEIQEIIATNKPYTIKLDQSIPVHIIYFTVYEENGIAYFKNDVYLYDKMIKESSASHIKDFFILPKKRIKFLPKKKKDIINQF